jgi:hypothetical protein
MVTLKATETLALERGRVSPGQVFQLNNKEAAQELIDAGRAEETNEEVTYQESVVVPGKVTAPKLGKAPKADKPEAAE